MLSLNKVKRTARSLIFSSVQNIQWCYVPEHVPHFSGLWEAEVKSFKHHFGRIMDSVQLTFKELTTVLTQIEACSIQDL